MNHGAWSVCDHSARADLLPLNGLRASQLNGMQVGPFRVLPDPVDTASTGFVLDTSEATYSVDLNSTALAGKVTAASRKRDAFRMVACDDAGARPPSGPDSSHCHAIRLWVPAR